MLDVSTDHSAPTVSLTPDFLKKEILRVGASSGEVKSALAFVASEASLNPRAYEALSPRMRRLVDLIAVADHSLSEKPFTAPLTASGDIRHD